MNTAADYAATRLQDKARADQLSPVVLVYVLGVLFPIMFVAGPLLLSTLRLLLLVITVPLMINILRGKYGRVYAADLLFPLFLVWSFVGLLMNSPAMAVENTGSTGLEFLGGYAIGRAYIRNSAQFVALCKLTAIAILCFLPFAVFEAVTGRPLLIELLDALPGSGTVVYLGGAQRLGLTRVQASFAHPIHFGLFCSIGVSLTFIALKGVINDGSRWIMTFLVILCGFLALSSGAIIAVIMQIALITWAAMFNRIEWRWWLLLGLFILAYILVDLLSNRTPLRVFMSYATFNAHNAWWRVNAFEWGMINIRDNPIFGIGFKDWIRPEWMHSSSVDNYWLLMTMRYGVPGLILLSAGMIIALFQIMRRDFRDNLKLLRIRRAWVFTIMGLIFTLCTVHIWHNIFSFVHFIFGAGIWLIAADGSDKDGPYDRPAPNPRAVSSRYARKTWLAEPVRTGNRTNEVDDSYTRFAPRPRT